MYNVLQVFALRQIVEEDKVTCVWSGAVNNV